MVDPERDDEGMIPAKIGRIDEGEFLLTASEISYMTRKFIHLYKNRLDQQANEKKNNHLEKGVQKKKYGEDFKF